MSLKTLAFVWEKGLAFNLDDIVYQSYDFPLFNAGSSSYDFGKSEKTSGGLRGGGQETRQLVNVGGPGHVHAGERLLYKKPLKNLFENEKNYNN